MKYIAVHHESNPTVIHLAKQGGGPTACGCPTTCWDALLKDPILSTDLTCEDCFESEMFLEFIEETVWSLDTVSKVTINMFIYGDQVLFRAWAVREGWYKPLFTGDLAEVRTRALLMAKHLGVPLEDQVP